MCFIYFTTFYFVNFFLFSQSTCHCIHIVMSSLHLNFIFYYWWLMIWCFHYSFIMRILLVYSFDKIPTTHESARDNKFLSFFLTFQIHLWFDFNHHSLTVNLCQIDYASFISGYTDKTLIFHRESFLQHHIFQIFNRAPSYWCLKKFRLFVCVFNFALLYGRRVMRENIRKWGGGGFS